MPYAVPPYLPRLLVAFAFALVWILAICWWRSTGSTGLAESCKSKSRHRPKKGAPARLNRRLVRRVIGGAVVALVAALVVRQWRRERDESAMPLAQRCSRHRFAYRGLGAPLRTEVPIADGALCGGAAQFVTGDREGV